jgi:itaconyl-CoA hydratase
VNSRAKAGRRLTPGGRPGWFADDVEPGSLVRHPGGRTITADEHVWLAWVMQNASDLHGNADRAARGVFGGPVVLGALTAAVVIGLAEPAEPPPRRAALGLPAGWSRIRLSSPVMPADTVRAESRITALEPEPDGDGAFVERTIVGRNQRGEEVAIIDERRWVARRDRGGTNDC